MSNEKTISKRFECTALTRKPKKIYNIYDDKIVDLYLNNKIKCLKPNLIKIKHV